MVSGWWCYAVSIVYCGVGVPYPGPELGLSRTQRCGAERRTRGSQSGGRGRCGADRGAPPRALAAPRSPAAGGRWRRGGAGGGGPGRCQAAGPRVGSAAAERAPAWAPPLYITAAGAAGSDEAGGTRSDRIASHRIGSPGTAPLSAPRRSSTAPRLRGAPAPSPLRHRRPARPRQLPPLRRPRPPRRAAPRAAGWPPNPPSCWASALATRR